MSEPRGGRGASKPRRRISPVFVLGELLITVGVLFALFVLWHAWFNDFVVDSKLHEASLQQSQQW